jgi:hypothetical protein
VIARNRNDIVPLHSNGNVSSRRMIRSVDKRDILDSNSGLPGCGNRHKNGKDQEEEASHHALLYAVVLSLVPRGLGHLDIFNSVERVLLAERIGLSPTQKLTRSYSPYSTVDSN